MKGDANLEGSSHCTPDQFRGRVRRTGTLRQSVASIPLGVEPTVLALWRGDGPRPESMWDIPVVLRRYWRIPIHHLGGGISLTALWWLLIHARRFDVVHVHAGRDLWVMLAMLVLRVRRVPYIWQTHGMLNRRDSGPIRVYDFLLVRGSMKSASTMLYLTPFEKRALEQFRVARRLELVINGVDSPDASAPSNADSGVRAVFVARLHPRKRAIDLTNAVFSLRAEGRDVELVLYGPDEGALAEIQAAIAAAGADPGVRYGGALSYEEVRPTLRRYNVAVLPSVNEPFPNSLLEAMASGLGVVCTASCGLAPYIERANAGMVVEPGEDGIRGALVSLLDGGESKIREYGERALELTRSTFSMNAIATRLRELYEDAIARR